MAAELKAEMKPTDLQELIAKYGTYSAITPEAWPDYDQKMAAWQARLRNGDFYYPPYRDVCPGLNSQLERLLEKEAARKDEPKKPTRKNPDQGELF